MTINDVQTAREHEGLMVEVMHVVQKATSAWLHLRWNGRWIFPDNAKVPSCLK
jgi:hypothetical protein